MLWEIPLLSLSSGLSWASSCFSSAGACLHHRDAPPLLPSDTTQGYRTVKAKLGSKKVRPWKWMPFTNPARKDGAMFYHWRRAAEEGKDYPFARFNKVSEVNFKQKRINSSCKLSFHQPFEYPVRKLVLSMCEGWNRFDSYILNCSMTCMQPCNLTLWSLQILQAKWVQYVVRACQSTSGFQGCSHQFGKESLYHLISFLTNVLSLITGCG